MTAWVVIYHQQIILKVHLLGGKIVFPADHFPYKMFFQGIQCCLEQKHQFAALAAALSILRKNDPTKGKGFRGSDSSVNT